MAEEFEPEEPSEFEDIVEEPLDSFEDEGNRFAANSAEDSSDDFSTDDLEQAYLRALDAMESAEWAVDTVEEADDVVEAESNLTPVDSQLTTALESNPGGEIAGADFLSGPRAASLDDRPDTVASAAAESIPQPTSNVGSQAKPARVIEACLFVGGQPLSAKKLANLLDGNNDPSDIEVLIDDLNAEYAAQGRPYEVRLGDGGYRLTLRAEFDAVRSRVYGMGPRDVKLSQDVLEVLALVAYQQPVTHAAVEACKPNSANILRQLLRRELVSLTRIDQSRNGVEYRTTPRFLQLFGLGQLSELPTPEDISIR